MKIIIPAYQPDEQVLKLIKNIKENSDYDIILIDDGSDFKCKHIFDDAKAYGCMLLTHKVNIGKGAALKTAFQYLLEHNNIDAFICADCDGQHTWEDIQKLAFELPSNPNSILLGCRKFMGSVPLRSMFGNKLTSAIFSLITGNKINDTQTGLRGFSASMLPWLIQLKGNRYEYEMNQLLEAKTAGYQFHYIIIETIYENKNKGSHFNPIKDSIRIYLPIIKFSISSILCALLDFVMLLIFKHLSDNLFFSVVAARIVSSICNYLMNKHLVFNARSKKKATTLLQYYILTVFILACNYIILSFLNEKLGISLVYSKIITEALLFVVSYTLQRKIIFKKSNS